MEKKFTADELDYIAFVARKFCDLCEPGWEKYVVENALDLFQWRANLIGCASKYELYKSTETLQERIKKHKIDVDKFWLLLLFLQDYTESCYGEYYIFDKESMSDNIEKMLNMLNQPDFITCELILSNKTETAHIDVAFIKDKLIELLQDIPQTALINSYPCIGKGEDNVIWHKIKFFMEMLDYFLTNYHSNSQQKTHIRKDWILIAQSLYLAGYLDNEKFLKGFEQIEREKTDIDGKVTTVVQTIPLKGLGKYLIDNTKNCKDTARRNNSLYCYKPYLDLVN